MGSQLSDGGHGPGSAVPLRSFGGLWSVYLALGLGAQLGEEVFGYPHFHHPHIGDDVGSGKQCGHSQLNGAFAELDVQRDCRVSLSAHNSAEDIPFHR